MPTLSGKTPAATFETILTINNIGAGLDGVLRIVEDGNGLQSPLQLSTSAIALNGQIWPSTGSTSGSFLRVSTTANTLEWHVLSATDISNILGYTPANSNSGSFSSPLAIKAVTIDTQQTVVTTNTATPVYTFQTTTGGTVKFVCQVHDTNSNAYQSEEILAVTDGSVVDITGFGQVVTQGQIGVFDALMSGSNVVLTFQAANASTVNVTVVANFVTT
jgi:hypothetical protein